MYIKGKLVYTEDRLFNDGDLSYQLNYTAGGQGLYWNNFALKLEDGTIYQGQWRKSKQRLNDKIEGLGTMVFKTGSRYQGMTKDKKFHGKGKMTH